METRESYNSPIEMESFRRFRAGEPVDMSWHEDWLAMIRAQTAEGFLWSRVRVVSLPLSDYSRFGLWGVGSTREAGDDIRYLTRDQAREARLPEHDFWLFDSRLLLVMHFADDDSFTHAEVIEDAGTIVEHNYRRDAARHHALTPDDFLTTHAQRAN